VRVELSRMAQRYQAVTAVQVDGLTVTEVDDKWGVSRQRPCTPGSPATRRAASRPWPTVAPTRVVPVCPPRSRPRTCELRREHPYRGPVRIAHRRAARASTRLDSKRTARNDTQHRELPRPKRAGAAQNPTLTVGIKT
jgi:hypothetical protein